MENTESEEIQQPIDTGNISNLDYPEFRYIWNPSARLSENFQSLLTAMTICKVEFITDIDIPEVDIHKKTYSIQSVLVNGPEDYVQFQLKKILNIVVNNLDLSQKV